LVAWPVTEEADWCGEYRPAGVPPASTEPVSVLTLSVRASKCVERLGVRMLGELAALSDSEIMSVRNSGETTLAEIRARLAERGLG
jgi:DNA-directed RNA polymerase subunit alpha